MKRHPDSREGAALVIALMVVGLLAIVVSSFAFDMHVEARVTSFHRKAFSAEAISLVLSSESIFSSSTFDLKSASSGLSVSCSSKGRPWATLLAAEWARSRTNEGGRMPVSS